MKRAQEGIMGWVSLSLCVCVCVCARVSECVDGGGGAFTWDARDGRRWV